MRSRVFWLFVLGSSLGSLACSEDLPDANQDTAASLMAIESYEPTGMTWYAAGDNHFHAYGCGQWFNEWPALLLWRMKQSETNIGHALLWGKDLSLNWTRFRGHQNDPVSQPGYILHWDIEISALAGEWSGHMQMLNVGHLDAVQGGVPGWPGGDFHLPNYAWAQSTGGIVGYAHGSNWTVGAYDLTGSPRELPVDIALEKVDFLSTEVADFTSGGGYTWLWYSMLDAGFEIAPAAGSDSPCQPQPVGIMQTMVPLPDKAPLTYHGYIDAIRAGKTVIRRKQTASQPSEEAGRLDLRVNSEPLGSTVTVPKVTTEIDVEVDAIADEGAPLELIVNGQVVGTTALVAGLNTYRWTVPIERSSWLAARTASIHTAATFVRLGNCPVRNDAQSASRWADYVDLYFQAGASQGLFVGEEAADIREAVDRARDVWLQIASDAALPPRRGCGG